MSAVNFILSLARKILARESKGITTIPNQMAVEQKAGEIAARLQDAGLPLNRADEFIKSEQDLTRILNIIESTPPVMKEVPSGIRSTKSAKIMDMEGKEIDPRSKIMGGKQAETEAEIAERLSRENKETVGKIKNRQKMLDDAIDDASPGFSGDRKYDAELVAENLAERMGLVYDDLPTKQRLDLYDQAYTGLSKKRQIQRESLEDFVDDAGGVDPDDPRGIDDFIPDDDPEPLAQGGRAGFFMGSANPKGLGLLRQLLNFFGKKSDVIKNPSDVLKVSNPKAFNKMLEDAKGKVISKEGIMATDKVKDYQTQMGKDRIEIVKDMLERGKRMKGADDKILAYQNDVKQRFMRELNMSEADAEKAAERMSTLAMDITKMEKTPKITEEGMLQLENVLKNLETGGKKKRELNATGGRIGFKDGMTRRTFLKIFGGLVSLPIVGKVLAPLKLTRGVSKVPIIKTDNVPGKPEWFDALVNKVIVEGDDVTKKFATGERQSIHQKTLDDGSVVRVTEDVDQGAVRVEYESDKNVFEDPVQLEYKKPLPDEGDPRPTAKFTTAESGPVGRQVSPDDYDIDVDEVGGTSIRDLDSDVSKLKEYATGQKPTMKELVQNIERRKKAQRITEDPEAQSDAVIRRQGEMLDYDTPDDFASGGIARMLGE